MKRFLFTLILLTKIAYGQQLRTTSSDTLCFPVTVIQRVLIAAEQKKVLQEQVSILNLRITEKDSIISLLKQKDANSTAIIKTYESEISVMKDQRRIFEGALKEQEKTIRKLKRKVFWTGAAGVVATGATAFILLTK